ncbi:MAG: TRAP transporter large permease [Alphaproteobacteria bacterium]|jgi:C4-dicarboxylate transporter, DctM subunit|nr:TRAP transporter large permease [Alphaproteobacteria bacterium]MBT4083842.1 TRAP transporter large permease [Alphaproteobacteria bacterium]MBT4542854.1 TRAP transporter large permease [Alphaproteobacteria bacterium]MBT7744230.1 TRAP transporter large permease [Alphaproteobacteria bacterium]
MLLALILVVLIILLLSGLPIFAGLGLMSMALLLIFEGQIGSLGEIVFAKLNIYLLVAVPLFALMAHIMVKSRVIDDLYKAAHTLVRHLPGGLGVATVLSCTIFAAISGSSVATALTIGTSAMPQMRRYGYRSQEIYGVIAAGGTLGILIPPSGPMILYAIVSGTSIGALFIGGIIPGLIIAGLFAAYSVFSARWQPDLTSEPRASMSEILHTLQKAFWALILPPVVLGGMYFGVFTATEGAAIGTVMSILITTLIYRDLTLKDLFEAAYDATRMSAMLFMLIAAAAMFSHALTIMRLPNDLVEWVVGNDVNQLVFILAVMALIVVLGMFLETIAIILITTPIVMPALIAYDINPVWYGILLMINLEMALITPPVGLNLFVIKGIAQAPLGEVIRGALPYVLLMMIGLFIVLAFPQVTLWLPSTMGYGR